jgi:hypothetical protein
MKQPNLWEVASVVADELRRLSVPYVVGGSVASMMHGEARLTNDVDIAAVVREQHVAPLVTAMQGPFYVDAELIRSAIRRRGIFNVIHIRSANKVDVHVLEPTPFEASQLKRAVPASPGRELDSRIRIASAEDIVLQKLLWYRKSEGALERQLRDIAGVLKLQGEKLDLEYMRTWAQQLDLAGLLEEQLLLAGLT